MVGLDEGLDDASGQVNLSVVPSANFSCPSSWQKFLESSWPSCSDQTSRSILSLNFFSFFQSFSFTLASVS